MSDEQLNRIESEVKSISVDISDIKVTLATQQVILAEHTRRSTLLEDQVKPLRDHLTQLKGVINFIKVVGIIAGIAEAARLIWK